MKFPRHLAQGARVALVAPAGPLRPDAIARATDRVQTLGWDPILAPHARDVHGYLAGTDADRLSDLQAALDDPSIDAIWCLRGGYGTMRILADLDLVRFQERSRPLIGFSDNTTLHLLLNRAGIVSFHGPHPGAPEVTDFSLNCLREIVSRPGAPIQLPLPSPGLTRPTPLVAGTAEGRLVGGNLALLAALAGTRFQIDARDRILFFEEVGESRYRIDRLLTQLLLSGAFSGVRGIAVGAITECPDDGRADLPSVEEVLTDRLGGLGVPVAIGFPFGHVPDQWTLPVGARAALDASAGTLTILEPAVTE